MKDFYEFHNLDGKPLYYSTDVEILVVAHNGGGQGTYLFLKNGPMLEVKETPEDVIKIIKKKDRERLILAETFYDAREECALSGEYRHCTDCRRYSTCWIKTAAQILPELVKEEII